METPAAPLVDVLFELQLTILSSILARPRNRCDRGADGHVITHLDFFRLS